MTMMHLINIYVYDACDYIPSYQIISKKLIYFVPNYKQKRQIL